MHRTIYRSPAAPCYISFSVSQGSWIVPMTRLFCICLPHCAGRARRDFPGYFPVRKALQTLKLLTCICLGKLSCRAIPGGNAFYQWEHFTPRHNSLGESTHDTSISFSAGPPTCISHGGEKKVVKKSFFQRNFGTEKCFGFIFKYSSSLSQEWFFLTAFFKKLRSLYYLDF